MPRASDGASAESHPSARTYADLVRALRRRLAEPLPGPSTDMVLHPRRLTAGAARAKGCREAAGLVLLYPADGTVATVLTVRGTHLRTHAGQVSLPGGGLEEGERTDVAALREAREELGVDVAAIQVLGVLSPVYIPPSDYVLTPVLAATPHRPTFVPAADEVDRIVEVDLAVLARPEVRRREAWELRGELRDVPFFAVGGVKVWGATALILSEVVTLWRDAMRSG